MMPISRVNTGAAQALEAARKGMEASKVRQSEKEAQGRSPKPVTDEYIPEEKQEPSGRYWMGKDEDGQPRIYFDDPERKADAPEKSGGIPKTEEPDQEKEAKGAKEAEKKGEKSERCVCNTDKVDREIEKLKKKKKELEQQISRETDETKIKDLEGQLAQVERELRQKDNDAYRRQHATYT